MAPLRGAGLLLRCHGVGAQVGRLCLHLQRLPRALPQTCPRTCSSFAPPCTHHGRGHITMRRFTFPTARRDFSTFTDRMADPVNAVQSYVSHSDDPYLNLAIEDHMLRKSSADSTILFLYVNRPCIVVGRNQNPWTEVNLAMLKAAVGTQNTDAELPAAGTVDLVRRRSGGGTVFHDEGNLNWSIICPRGDFTRDKHAEMTVRALRRLGIERARVNERHDIVLDQGQERRASDPEDTHRTPYTADHGGPQALKVSGSAYKLTRQRALHHATTLLCSPNLHVISKYLRSPAQDFIQAKGVESVSSPVANIGLPVDAFKQHLQQEFGALYGHAGPSHIESVGAEHLGIPDVRKGYDELKSQDWMWSQTPQFDLSLQTSDDVGIDMNIRHGVINTITFKDDRLSEAQQEGIRSVFVDRKLQNIGNWASFLKAHLSSWDVPTEKLAYRLNEIMPIPELKLA